jgi:signal transduction histidine kinase
MFRLGGGAAPAANRCVAKTWCALIPGMGGSWWAAVACLCVGLACGEVRAGPLGGERGRDRRILMLNSYHPQFVWTDELVRGALAELHDLVHEENVHVEYMDLRRMLDDAAYLDELAALLASKYADRKPSVILASDDGATRFLLTRRELLFPGVPIVFCGINSIPEDELARAPAVTGLMEGLEIERNLQLIERLHSGVRRIVLLTDRSSLGRGMAAAAHALPAATHSAELELWDDFTLPELHARMAAAGPDTAFLMLAIHRDRDGAYFSFASDLPQLIAASRSPVYGMFGMLLGSGVVGGFMNDPREHGGAAAALVRRVLAGVPADDIPIGHAVYAPRFDWRALRRFAIDDARLPPGSQIVGRPFSLYESYRAVIWTSIVLVLTLLSIVAGLLYLVFRMRRAERALVASHQALQRAQRAELIGQLSGGIAHDFNNLLVPILMGAELLSRRLDGADLADVEMIRGAATSARDMARQLLDLGRDEPLSLRAVDLRAALPPVIALLRKSGVAVELVLEPPPTALVAQADGGQLQRVVMNLVMNAHDALAANPTARITVSATSVELRRGQVADLVAGRYVRLRVADNGPGMDAPTVERIFEPFFTTKARGRGAGLGLSTVQAIVRQHGGVITVDSAPACGARFDVFLRPCEHSLDAETQSPPAAWVTAPTNSRPAR